MRCSNRDDRGDDGAGGNGWIPVSGAVGLEAAPGAVPRRAPDEAMKPQAVGMLEEHDVAEPRRTIPGRSDLDDVSRAERWHHTIACHAQPHRLEVREAVLQQELRLRIGSFHLGNRVLRAPW